MKHPKQYIISATMTIMKNCGWGNLKSNKPGLRRKNKKRRSFSFFYFYMMEDHKKYFETNREFWNKRTAVHKDSSFYDLAGFKAVANALTSIQFKEVGGVKGKSLLHLYFHFCINTMSW